MKKAIEYLLIFIVVQVIVTYCVKGVWYLATGDSGRESGMLIVLTSILVGLAAIALFVWRKWTPVSGNYIQSGPWWVFFWSFLAALGMYLPAEWVLENMPELPNILKESFGDIINTPGGYLALGVRGVRFHGEGLGRHCHFSLALCLGSHESCTDALCLCGWPADGMDVLAYGKHSSGHCIPCDDKHAFLCPDATLFQCG